MATTLQMEKQSKCVKNEREEQTVYQDLEGNEIKVNDGNTFVNICPTDAKVVLEEPASVETPQGE